MRKSHDVYTGGAASEPERSTLNLVGDLRAVMEWHESDGTAPLSLPARGRLAAFAALALHKHVTPEIEVAIWN